MRGIAVQLQSKHAPCPAPDGQLGTWCCRAGNEVDIVVSVKPASGNATSMERLEAIGNALLAPEGVFGQALLDKYGVTGESAAPALQDDSAPRVGASGWRWACWHE